jgi:hypothetical protein
VTERPRGYTLILALVGFGPGVCGTPGLIMAAVEGTRGAEN